MTIKDTLLENIVDIIKRYETGESMNSIAKSYGTNSGNLYYILKDKNVLRKDMSKNYGQVEILYKDIIIELFNSGKSGYAIAKEINVSKPVVLKLMKKLNLSTSHKSTQREDKLVNHTEEIVELFKSGISANQIAIKFKAGCPNILQLLNKAGLDTSLKMYSFDETFFDKIDTEEKAWVLGLMYTDGNNRGDDTIRLTMCDLDIIQKVKKAWKTESPISSRPGRKSNHKTQYTISISRKGISQKLTNLGCPPNKTFKLSFPNTDILPANLHAPFIRGALDGDGSVTKNMIAITGNKPFLYGIEKCVLENVGIKLNWYNRYPNKGPDYSIRMIATTNFVGMNILATYLYKNASIYGIRKLDNAISNGYLFMTE